MKEGSSENGNHSKTERQHPRGSRALVRRAGLALMLAAVSFALMLGGRVIAPVAALGAPTRDGPDMPELEHEERQEFLSYVWGIGLAVLLTVVPFGLVHWFSGMPHLALFIVIGVLALVQMLVHFHFFLHIGLRQNREDLQLLLFSALLLIIMVAGTLWIMTSLAWRMALPGSP